MLVPTEALTADDIEGLSLIVVTYFFFQNEASASCCRLQKNLLTYSNLVIF